MATAEHDRTVQTLIAAGYTQAPQMGPWRGDDQPWQYLDGWAESTLTRRQMLDAMPAREHARRIEVLATFPEDLDAIDRQPVRLAMRRARDVQLGLDQWVTAEYAAGRIAPGYAVVELRARGGRPSLGVPIQVRLDADSIAAIDVSAAAQGITRPEWIRRAVAAALARA